MSFIKIGGRFIKRHQITAVRPSISSWSKSHVLEVDVVYVDDLRLGFGFIWYIVFPHNNDFQKKTEKFTFKTSVERDEWLKKLTPIANANVINRVEEL